MTPNVSIRRWEPSLWPLCATAAILSLWSAGVWWSGTRVFPSPVAVERALAELLRKGLLWRYIGDSLFRVGAGPPPAITRRRPPGGPPRRGPGPAPPGGPP